MVNYNNKVDDILEDSVEWAVKDCKSCRKPTLFKMGRSGKWRCTECPKRINNERRKNGKRR